MDRVETLAAHMPPMVYCKMENIVSPSGAEAEGWLISVGGTPKEMLARSPEFTYRRLLAAGVSIHARNYSGQTPLLQAARGGHLAVVERLLEFMHAQRASEFPSTAARGKVWLNALTAGLVDPEFMVRRVATGLKNLLSGNNCRH